MSELLECPFCDGKPVRSGGYDWAYVRCPKQNPCATMERKNIAEAEKAWNNRHPSESDRLRDEVVKAATNAWENQGWHNERYIGSLELALARLEAEQKGEKARCGLVDPKPNQGISHPDYSSCGLPGCPNKDIP